MSKREFFHSTPHDLEVFINETDRLKKMETEMEMEKVKYVAWLNGVYVQRAVASVLSKKSKYPKQPLGSEEEHRFIEVTNDMPEDEKDEALELLTDNLKELFLKPNKKQDRQG